MLQSMASLELLGVPGDGMTGFVPVVPNPLVGLNCTTPEPPSSELLVAAPFHALQVNVIPEVLPSVVTLGVIEPDAELMNIAVAP